MAEPHQILRQESHISNEKHADEAAIKHSDDSVIADITSAQFEDPNLDKGHLVLEDDSPYPEVRSAVANTDDPDMPVSTLRAWIIGILWAVLIPGVNQFFFFRFPSVTITGIVAQLLSFPIGRAAAAWIPDWTIFGLRLNPGPFMVKEHVLITIMATVGYQSAYATDIVAVQRVYYNQLYNFSYQWFIVMSTQLIGFSIGGIARRFLVAPPSMIWPLSLVNCALFNTLHSTQYAGIGTRGGLSLQALSYFSWVTWIRPDDPSELRDQPLSTSALDHDSAKPSLHFLGTFMECTTFAISYGLSFASITATLVHTFLYFRKQIWLQSRRALNEQPDIHARLMSRYPQVPEWWYLIIFLSMFALGIISIEVWPRTSEITLNRSYNGIAFTYIIPIGMIQAITNQQIGLK
ncbi:hypothetical protein C0995_013225 [Termitomyces sp. Mi166|nr:hypothetical protein C0995_013225 [Termitomyces sp. Mi166\